MNTAAIRFIEKTQDDYTVKCNLCPHRCAIKPGKNGVCKVRANKDGQGKIPFYGFATALANDPIEKKPLYHFRPGSEILSIGFSGCNLQCPFCQNWHISQNTEIPGRNITPKELIQIAKNCKQIAYTYSEPLVHVEFLIDCMKEARKAGIANVLVTNGCANHEAAEEVLALTDAANIDLKCFSKETYKKILGGDLETVLNFIRTACSKGVHVELTTLVVPGLNDSVHEIDDCIDFIAGLQTLEKPIPWHLSAYHPDWKYNAPATSPDSLSVIAARVKKRLTFVYTGNISGEKNDTSCIHCGNILVKRHGYRVNLSGLKQEPINDKKLFFCTSCGKEISYLCG